MQALARDKYRVWRANPSHPSLRFKLVDPTERIFSVRVGDHHRALCTLVEDAYIWFWIGTHEEYNGRL